MPKKPRHAALALLEFDSIASGILASDLMVKRSPIALLRCGTIHPGRFLVLVGGSVASTEEAHYAGCAHGEAEGTLHDSVLLSDIHPALHDAVLGARQALAHEALAVVETANSPALLRAIDAAVKSTPVAIGEVRLADDLGGRAIALLYGDVADAVTALEICNERIGSQLIGNSLLPRLDVDLRTVLARATECRSCPPHAPAGAEHLEEVTCSWDE
jgi:microcompartment protein CcmL/EutN